MQIARVQSAYNKALQIDNLQASQIKSLSAMAFPLLSESGFSELGELGEYVRHQPNGDRHGVLIDSVKQKNTYVIELRTLIYYADVESRYSSIESAFPYTVNVYQHSETIPTTDNDTAVIIRILKQMIVEISEPFFEGCGTSQTAFENLSSKDYKVWFTSDKLSQYKIKIAAAIQARDRNALSILIEEANNLCNSPVSIPYRAELRGIHEAARDSI